ncbi:MAG: 50S ribosomal protein L22 [Pseudomonadota bacterium]|nr:50S ribosomal protein L22 [Pseudomonadota bacterium]
MNTAARDRALLPTIKDVLGRTPVSKLKLTKEKDGTLKVLLHTSRPNNVRMEAQALTEALTEQIGANRTVTVEVVAEARAVAKWVRTSPRKARLVIDAIKGKRVSEALAMLRFIPNHAAELITKVVISAAANAQDGWGAGVEELKVQNILADGGPTLKRVRARAQGRAYRILKRTSHLTVILTDAPAVAPRPRRATATPAKPKAAQAPAAPKAENVALANQSTTEQAGTEVALDTPVAAPAEENRQVPGSEQGEGGTGDTANTSDSGQSQAPKATAAVSEEPHEATPVTVSDSPEIDVSDRAPDPSEGADQKREEGE